MLQQLFFLLTRAVEGSHISVISINTLCGETTDKNEHFLFSRTKLLGFNYVLGICIPFCGELEYDFSSGSDLGMDTCKGPAFPTRKLMSLHA